MDELAITAHKHTSLGKQAINYICVRIYIYIYMHANMKAHLSVCLYITVNDRLEGCS